MRFDIEEQCKRKFDDVAFYSQSAQYRTLQKAADMTLSRTSEALDMNMSSSIKFPTTLNL